jgi:hypothetical protein
VPDTYISTDTDNVFREPGTGRPPFILRDGKAYAVSQDASGALRLAVPDDPSQLGSTVMRNASGEWEATGDASTPGSAHVSGDNAVLQDEVRAGTSTQRDDEALTEERTAAYILTHPHATMPELETRFSLPAEVIRQVAADVDEVRRAWSGAGSSGAEAAAATDAQLTPRQKGFIDRWAGPVSANNFAELMQQPLEQINAYLHSDEHRSAAVASGSFDVQPPSAEQDSIRIAQPGSRISPEKRARIIRMLTANPSMPYYEVATACSSNVRTVAGLARDHGLQRDIDSRGRALRSDLFDDFILFPESRPSELADEYGTPVSTVRAFRAEFDRLNRDWQAVRQADISDSRPELQALLSDHMKSFIVHWSGKMSAANLAILMGKPDAAIDAYMHSDEYRRLVSGSGSAGSSSQGASPDETNVQREVGGVPQSSPPSSPHASLTSRQKVQIRAMGSHGYTSDTMSRYLGVPVTTIVSYMHSDEYRDYVRGLPNAFLPPASPGPLLP